MTRAWGWTAALAFSLCSAAAAAPPSTPYFEAAAGLGDWLIDATQQGQRWPHSLARDGTTPSYQATLGLDTGAAGIGLFFLGLHEHSGEARHLEMARAAADFEEAQHRAGNYNGFDYLSGAAGSGLFLLALHARTGEQRYLDRAIAAADWLESTALIPAPGERYWRHSPTHPRTYTGIPHGATGVALFQLALHQRTGDARYLEAAQSAYRWVRNYRLPIGTTGAIGFKRLVDDADVYNWWSGGSAGVVLLQAALYGTTGNPDYLADLQATADGLLVLSDPAFPAGRNWTTGSNRASYRPFVFSHGNAGVVPALMIAHEHLGDPDYLAAAKASIDWLAATARDGAQQQSTGVFWEHSQGSGFPDLKTTGAFIGTASVGWMLARMHALQREPRLRTLALTSADYLLGIGERLPGGRRRWLDYVGAEQSTWGAQRYTLGWYDGNAGIGLFLLAVHELSLGQRPRLDVHAP
jgi:lantibiotic modifying enzyme